MLHKPIFKKNDNEGFTIIEVLIVLAIAALILLIVFLAVPALQRTARNNSRKNDAARISTSIANWISNNNGALPGLESGTYASATFTSDCGSILSDVGNLAEFASFTCNGTAATTINATQVTYANGAQTLSSGGQVDGIFYDEEATCPTTTTNTGPSIITGTGNTRQSAIVYTLETASGNYNLSCIQSS